MKYLFLVLLIFVSSAHLAAQSDTAIIYLDGNEKPCPEDKATRYAIQIKEKDYWKKVVFDISDDKPIWGAHFADYACTLFDGPYTAFNKKQKIITNGRYINNKKTGIWKSFANDGKLIDSALYRDGFIFGIALTWYNDGSVSDSLFFEKEGKGTGKGFWPDGKPKDSGSFLRGKKNDLWTYYSKSGIKCQEVKYEADSALSFICYDETGNVQTDNCYYEKEATFKGGDKAWLKYLLGKLGAAKYPDAYFQGRSYGIVYVQFIVGADGKIIDAFTINSVDKELDEIALKIIQQSPRWEPAVQFNRNVKAYRKQPITFSKVEQ